MYITGTDYTAVFSSRYKLWFFRRKDPRGYLARLADSYSYSEYVIINLGFFTVLQHYFKISRCTQLYEIYVIFKIYLLMILHTNLYHFILKYNIYIFIYKLRNFVKFGWLLLKPFSYAISRELNNINVLKHAPKALDSIKHLMLLNSQK